MASPFYFKTHILCMKNLIQNDRLLVYIRNKGLWKLSLEYYFKVISSQLAISTIDHNNLIRHQNCDITFISKSDVFVKTSL